MERNEILKTIGFSDSFLTALKEFDNSVPNVFYDVPFIEKEQVINVVDTSGEFIINRTNDSHNISIEG